VTGSERERTSSAAIAAIVTIGTMSSADSTASGLTPFVLGKGSNWRGEATDGTGREQVAELGRAGAYACCLPGTSGVVD
jgi:hypothetical protein